MYGVAELLSTWASMRSLAKIPSQDLRAERLPQVPQQPPEPEPEPQPRGVGAGAEPRPQPEPEPEPEPGAGEPEQALCVG